MIATPLRRLFLDTEWADSAAHDLVSLALVSADGAQRFYAEVDPLPASPTPFVRRVVYPLLDRGAAALSPAVFTHALRTFLAGVAPPGHDPVSGSCPAAARAAPRHVPARGRAPDAE